MNQFLDEASELAHQLRIEPTLGVMGERRGEVGPFEGHGQAVLAITQDDGVDSADAALLQYAKAFASTWMEGMRDLGPTQNVIGLVCS